MKFYKRLPLDRHKPTSVELTLMEDGRIVTSSNNSLELPAGTKLERPTQIVNGQIRYNTDVDKIEARVATVWKYLRLVEPASLTVQNLGVGNNQTAVFGPLNVNYAPSYAKGDANVMVYVDNVYQIPGVNYTLGNASSATNTTARLATAGTFTIYLNSLTNVLVGQTISGNSNIPQGTTVQSITTAANAIGTSLAVTGAIASGTSLTFTFSSGTYINFNGTVPFKPVYAVLGFDGYFPPAP